ncbi:MAG: S4 domain-containing protein [Pseudomonadota bacterium]
MLVRLSKFLSLAVAMSRNQAKFFIRKGRLSVDGNAITDPEFDVADTSDVVFDGKPISIAAHQYVLMHKPASYSCTTKSTEYPSVLELLNDRPEDRYYYFANVLAPEATGLVLFSDDARWTSRIKRRNRRTRFSPIFASSCRSESPSTIW